MQWLDVLCVRLARWALHVASACLAGLGLVVIFGVVMRYAFNDPPAYVEQVALLLVITVAMFGAAAGVQASGHIGLDSVVKLLPQKLQTICIIVVELLVIVFAVFLLWGSAQMGLSTRHDDIPTLGISEAWRYAPSLIAGALILLFSIDHLLALKRPSAAG